MSKKKHNIKPKQKETVKLPMYLWAAIMACAVTVVVVIVSFIVLENRPPKVEFIPPAFEANAVEGTPDVPEECGYSELYQDGMTYRAGICGEVFTENGEAVVYFTNPKSNTAWLKLRITDGDDNILGESGIVKPGEYVRSVILVKEITVDTEVKIKLMGYEAETYNSVGSVVVKTKIIVK